MKSTGFASNFKQDAPLLLVGVQRLCIKNPVVPKDLQIRPPVSTKGTRRVTELAFTRFLREEIRLIQKAKEAESTTQSMTSALSTNDANRILEQIKTNTQHVFHATKDREKQEFENTSVREIGSGNVTI